MRRVIFESEHDQFRETVRRFMETQVAPHCERFREAGMVDRELYTKAGQAGLLCTWADERFGGAGIDDFRFEQIIIEENMRHGDIGFYINLHSDLVAPYNRGITGYVPRSAQFGQRKGHHFKPAALIDQQVHAFPDRQAA